MCERNYDSFQQSVDSYLIRHRSVLDITSKYQEASARVNRAVVKAATNCGCVSIKATRQDFPENIDSYIDIKTHMKSHIEGTLCEVCQDVIEVEIGNSIFYLAALLNTLGLRMEDILEKEQSRIDTFGVYRLT